MDSFALVYFEDEKRYSAVAVASLKGGSENLNKGSEVIVLGSYFDPVTNAPIDVEWPAKFVKFGSERELKREAPRFNEKARHFEELESLKASRKRKSNPRYEVGKDDANEENRTVKKKKNAKQPLQEKHVVPLPSDSADEYVLSSDVEEDEVMFLEKLTKKALGQKKNKKSVKEKKKSAKTKKPAQLAEDTHEDDSKENYKEKYLELQLQLQIQEQLQKEITREKTAEEKEKNEKERKEWEEEEKRKQKEKEQREKEEKEREEWEKSRQERERFRQWKEREKRKQKEREQREKEKKKREEEQRETRLKEIETLEKRRQEEKEQVEKQRRMQEYQTRGSTDDVGHMNDSSEEAEDDELDWLTELSAIKPKCAGCSFLAKQLHKIEKELKTLNEKQHRSKKAEAAKSTEEDEQELMQKEKVTKNNQNLAMSFTNFLWLILRTMAGR